MTEIVRFEVGNGSVLVETEEDTFGVQNVARGEDGVVEAGRRLEDALASVRDAANASLNVLNKLSPNSIEIEFGVRLAGEAGALIAKASTEGHFTVKMSWTPDSGTETRESANLVSRDDNSTA